MHAVDDEIPHPTHIGLNIAKVIPEDRPEPTDGQLPPHPEPDRVAAPVREVLGDTGELPSGAYLDQVATEAGRTLARVWDLPEQDVVAWVRHALADGLEGRDGG